MVHILWSNFVRYVSAELKLRWLQVECINGGFIFQWSALHTDTAFAQEQRLILGVLSEFQGISVGR